MSKKPLRVELRSHIVQIRVQSSSKVSVSQPAGHNLHHSTIDEFHTSSCPG